LRQSSNIPQDGAQSQGAIKGDGVGLSIHYTKTEKEKEGVFMKKKAVVGLVGLSFLMVLSGLTGCGKNAYFGVRNETIGVPPEFRETEAAIEKAEKSPGAQYAPEKITRARSWGKMAVETYWDCRTAEAMAMLAEARKLAGDAELAKAPAKPAPVVAAAPKPKPAPARVTPAPAPKPVAVPPKVKRIIVLQGANFAFDSAELTPETRAILDEQAALLGRVSDVKVKIEGHTDSTGPEDYNQDLSERRAKEVEGYIISKGISADRIEIMGYGPSSPIAPNDTKEGRAKNRRVEMKVLER
jgi:outer membrane protein OmpA-like peptidoglycan-associated protein